MPRRLFGAENHYRAKFITYLIYYAKIVIYKARATSNLLGYICVFFQNKNIKFIFLSASIQKISLLR